MEWGLGALRLRPADFWRMSLAEWVAARDGAAAAAGQGMMISPVMRQELENLMKTYPDRKTHT